MSTTTSFKLKSYALEEYIKKKPKTHLIQEALEDMKFIKANEKEDAFWETAYDNSEWV